MIFIIRTLQSNHSKCFIISETKLYFFQITNHLMSNLNAITPPED